MENMKENFLKILSSTKPEELTDLIMQNSKIKPMPLREPLHRIKQNNNR